MIIWSDGAAVSGDTGDAVQTVAVAGGTAARQNFITSTEANNVSTISRAFLIGSGGAFDVASAAGAQTVLGTISSWDATGFTVNWSTIVSGTIFHYLAIGGTDVSSFTPLNTTNSIATTGTQAITGVGFRPKLVFFVNWYNVVGGSTGFGAAVDSTHRWAISSSGASSGTMSSANLQSRVMDTTKCMVNLGGGGVTTIIGAADLVSMDADGFTLNWTTNSGSTNNNFGYLCLGGAAEFEVGNFSKQANTTQTTITVAATSATTPSAYLIAGTTAIGTAATATGNLVSIGATDGTRSSSVVMEAAASALPTQARRYADAGGSNLSVLRQRAAPTSVSAPGTTSVVMTHNAFTADGFTVNLPTNNNPTFWIYAFITFAQAAISEPTNPTISGPVDAFN
jgi:hypothetical protein